MKYISTTPLLIAALAACTLLPCSCLDEDPKGQMPESEAYSSAKAIELNCVATLYNYIGGHDESQGLQGTDRGVYDWNSLTTDEQMLPIRGGDWYDGGFWQRLYEHSWTSTDNALFATWNYLYKVVILCNRSLHQIEAHKNILTEAQRRSYEGEVRALRAMYYWYIMDLWGNVPLVTTHGTSLAQTAQSKRSTVFRFIVDELQEAAETLPLAHSNYEGNYYGRITRPVAWFMLAKLALNAEIYADDTPTDDHYPAGSNITFTVDGRSLNAWQTTVVYCDKIAGAGYRLADDYASNFAIHNENSVENIFTIPMQKTFYTNQFQYLFRSRHYRHGSAISMDAENGTVATLSTVKKYGYGTATVDARWPINFYADTLLVDGKKVLLEDGTPLIYRPLAVTAFNLTGTEYEKTAGARMSKYEIDRTAYSDGKLQGNDIVLFRYADVLLMKAEAKVRNGEDGSAELNAVRNRVRMGARTATLENILDERLLELMWEGWRRQDLIRFGLFDRSYDLRTALASEKDHHTIVFPIPKNAISLNGNLKQNEGY